MGSINEALGHLQLNEDPVVGTLHFKDYVLDMKNLRKAFPKEDVLKNKFIENDSIEAYIWG